MVSHICILTWWLCTLTVIFVIIKSISSHRLITSSDRHCLLDWVTSGITDVLWSLPIRAEHKTFNTKNPKLLTSECTEFLMHCCRSKTTSSAPLLSRWFYRSDRHTLYLSLSTTLSLSSFDRVIFLKSFFCLFLVSVIFSVLLVGFLVSCR